MTNWAKGRGAAWWVGASVVAALVLSGLGAVAGAVLASDKAAVTGTIVGAGTFLLAAIAAVVALLAYAQSRRVPVVVAEIKGPGLHGDRSLLAGSAASSQWAVTVQNNGAATARNLVVTVTIDGRWGSLYRASATAGWVEESSEGRDLSRYQWDGGVNFAVHTFNQKRTLPVLIAFRDRGPPTTPAAPRLVLEVVCDGSRFTDTLELTVPPA